MRSDSSGTHVYSNFTENKMAADHLQTIMAIFEGPNGTFFAIGAAILIVLLTIVIAWLISRNRNKRNTVLLLGLSDSGKTVLFTRLHYGKFMSTHTSIKENQGSYKLNKKDNANAILPIIDIPGNEKLRGKFIEQFKDLARGIIFVVDSINFSREVHGVAECLFDILSNKTFNKLSPKVLIACNKQDLTTSKSMNVIKSQLAKEITTLRKTRAAAVKGLDEKSMTKDSVAIGQRGKDFDFADLKGIRVEFVECSAKGGNDNVADIKNIEMWLNKLI